MANYRILQTVHFTNYTVPSSMLVFLTRAEAFWRYYRPYECGRTGFCGLVDRLVFWTERRFSLWHSTNQLVLNSNPETTDPVRFAVFSFRFLYYIFWVFLCLTVCIGLKISTVKTKTIAFKGRAPVRSKIVINNILWQTKALLVTWGAQFHARM